VGASQIWIWSWKPLLEERVSRGVEILEYKAEKIKN
jgi:hypothetical protein